MAILVGPGAAYPRPKGERACNSGGDGISNIPGASEARDGYRGEMTAPTPYIHLPGTAREALVFYGDVFGGAVELHTFEEFNRTDGPPDAIAHGHLTKGPVELFVADVTGDSSPRFEGMTLALLGTTVPSVLRSWFSRLSEGGEVVDDLQTRLWGATDGQVIDRFWPPLAHRIRGRREPLNTAASRRAAEVCQIGHRARRD